MSMRGVDSPFARAVLERTIRRPGGGNLRSVVLPGMNWLELECVQNPGQERVATELLEALSVREKLGASKVETLELRGVPRDSSGLRELEDLVGRMVLS